MKLFFTVLEGGEPGYLANVPLKVQKQIQSELGNYMDVTGCWRMFLDFAYEFVLLHFRMGGT